MIQATYDMFIKLLDGEYKFSTVFKDLPMQKCLDILQKNYITANILSIKFKRHVEWEDKK